MLISVKLCLFTDDIYFRRWRGGGADQPVAESANQIFVNFVQEILNMCVSWIHLVVELDAIHNQVYN